MKALITGSTGFIGSSLKKKTGAIPVEVQSLPRVRADYFLHFGSPSSDILFKEDINCVRETIDDFIRVVEYCKKRHIKLIFPSSATVYENKSSYSHTKMALEEIVGAYDIPYLSLRIFAGYGPGEGHKKHYASVVYKWVDEIKRGKTPIIYGDGTQSRDFVYIDDIVRTIIENKDQEGVLDIGTGVSTSFNDLFKLIVGKLGVDTKPVYVDKPATYLEKTVCNNPLKNFTSIERGIECLLNY